VGEKLKVGIQTNKKKTKDLSGKFGPVTARVLADGGAEIIYTANIKDFKIFDFIEAINPFEPIANLQSINEQDVAAVCKVLRSDWLTTGPKVQEFERAIAN